ncbi:unnamed protein product [Sphenostylis stenocarpa]|uniref:Uncharacterized protein n=1 Tax=Sphenostylis stenocarpa TaxID=92480 RepID=A0AA86T1I7_9FABA|nr:unnamed protein product [Sphenostylis stenocarpa]
MVNNVNCKNCHSCIGSTKTRQLFIGIPYSTPSKGSFLHAPPSTSNRGRVSTPVAPVPETDALRYPARNLVSPTPLLVMPLPIVGNPGPAAPDLIR